MSGTRKKSRTGRERSVQAIFYDSQYTKDHEENTKKLKKIFIKTQLKDFSSDFIHCLTICLTHPEENELAENALNFAAKFSVCLSNNVRENETCPFLEGVFQFLFENHGCDNSTVRFRICRFINRVFDYMGQEALIDEEIYEMIGTCMMERLQDKLAKVRAEAVFALYRLQDPSDPSCRIISVFKFHLKSDPSHEVRSAILQKIAVNKGTLPFVVQRIHDIKDTVRKFAYVVLSKLSVKRFSIRQRQSIIEKGLNDKFAMVRNFVIKVLLPNWLEAYNSNYLEFLQSINVESFSEVGLKTLKELFKIQHVVPLASMGIENKLIPYSKLSSERVFFWRALAEFLKPTDDSSEKNIQYFENILPDLTPFTDYIRRYFFPPIETERENAPTEFVLVQLLEMTKIYDFSDEMGRSWLKGLCMDLLLSSKVGPATVTVIAQLLKDVMPNGESRLSFMAEAVSELREPLTSLNASSVDKYESIKAEISSLQFELYNLEVYKKKKDVEDDEEFDDIEHFARMNKTKLRIKELEIELLKLEKPEGNFDEFQNTCDVFTLNKCLSLVTSIIESEDITEMNPILYSLLQNFILPTIESEDITDITVQNLALQALGVFCILDVQLAKEKFLMLCFQIANEFLCATSLKVVFDLLFYHGLEAFNIEEPTGELIDCETQSGSSRRKSNLMHLLISLLNSQTPIIRITTMQGLCKLLYSRRLNNPNLITRLIVMWLNPDFEEDIMLRQSLTVFFNLFATTSPSAPSMMLDCFLPTIKAFSSGEYGEILDTVDPEYVAKLMINLTRPHINKYNLEKNIHNQLAVKICEEVLECAEEPEVSVLVKVLPQLELNSKLYEDMENIKHSVRRIKQLLSKRKDKTVYRSLLKFEMLLEINEPVSTVENTFPASDPSNCQRSRIRLIEDRESNSESDYDIESCESSPIRFTSKGIVIPESDCEEVCSEGIIIPESPSSEAGC